MKHFSSKSNICDTRAPNAVGLIKIHFSNIPSSKGRGYSRIYKKKSKRFVTYLTHTVSENHPDLVGKRGGSRECVCPQHLCVKQPNGRIYTVRSSLPLTDRPWEPNVAPGHIFAY